MNRLTIFLVLSCIGLIFYLSWLPSGKLGKETMLPNWLLAWSNTYFNLRTALPFIGLGILCLYATNLALHLSLVWWLFA